MAFAKQRGARVIAMDVNVKRLNFCRDWAKADDTVHLKNNPMEQLMELSNGDLPTVVFDATGNAKSMTDAFQYVSHGGRLVYVGLVKMDITFSDPEFHKKELTLMGSRNATLEDFDIVLDAVRSVSIDTERYITHRAGFDQMIDEFAAWLNPESGVIKAMVEV
jgi:threonine dehydrogenase-like Zn-dependent dehydrogenase